MGESNSVIEDVKKYIFNSLCHVYLIPHVIKLHSN